MNKVFISPSAPGTMSREPVQPVVDLCFPIVQGGLLEVDHGHALYRALAGACAGLERVPGLGVHTVRGIPAGRRGDLILTQSSEVQLRIPGGSAAPLHELAGAVLDVRGHRIQLGEPYLQALAPVSGLWARTVTIHFQDPGLAAAQAELASRFARDFPWGSFRVLRSRTIRRQGRQLLGFEMAVRGLSPAASLQLQGHGFGGWRALGCGLFVPFAATAKAKAKAS